MRKQFALVLAMVAFAATACIRSDTKIVVNDDGSGTVTLVQAIDPEAFASLAESFGSAGGTGTGSADLANFCETGLADMRDSLPSGAKVEKYKDGKFCGYRASFDFAAGELDSALTDAQSAGSIVGADSEGLSITKDGSGWKFSANLGGSAGSSTDLAGSEALFKNFLKDASVVVRVKLPGRYVEADSNADRIEGDGTLVWNIDILNPTEIKARTEAGSPITNKVLTDRGKDVAGTVGASSTIGGSSDSGSSKTWLWIVLGLVVVGGVAFVVLSKRKKTSTPAAVGVDGGFTPPMAGDFSPPAAPSVPSAPSAPAEPVTSAAADGPQWDAARNAYIQYDHGSQRWLQYDDTDKAWKPIE
jgi:LPXTG-motif cell wall-anchored protein